ncbi:MAG: response regulator [Planctomycetota bacterium]|jgi:DNA-binding response OmpR family regulator
MEYTKYKVLLIEDNKLDRMAFERFVCNEKLQYDYTAAQSISEAKEILDSERFDIIVSDYSLGDGTALDILNSVKDTPIILITAAEDEEVPINARRAGTYDYLPKDLDRNYLKAVPKTIENAIKHKKVEQALGREPKNLEAMFNSASVGMLLVDENMIIARANDAIKRMLHKNYSQIVNHRLGYAIGCINSTNNNKVCGFGRACTKCLLKKAISSVLDSGQSVQRLEIHPTLKVGNKKNKTWFCISIERAIVDGCTCLIIAVDDVTEHKKAKDIHTPG